MMEERQQNRNGRSLRTDGFYAPPAERDPLADVNGHDPGVRNFIIREVGMSADTPKSDILLGQYSDRFFYFSEENMQLAKDTWGSGDLGLARWAASASDSELLEFGARVYGQELKGFRVSASSNCSNGAVIYLMQGVAK